MTSVGLRLSRCRGALDRLRTAVGDADLDLLRLHLLGLRNVDLEDPVLVRGLDRVLGHALRQADGAGERAETTLEAGIALLRDLSAPLALGAGPERAGPAPHRELLPGH